MVNIKAEETFLGPGGQEQLASLIAHFRTALLGLISVSQRIAAHEDIAGPEQRIYFGQIAKDLVSVVTRLGLVVDL